MTKWREPVSALTHLIGAILAIPIGILLAIRVIDTGNIYYLLSVVIFSVSLFGLYLASTLYHMLPLSDKYVAVLKKIDHQMIFILIAGSYTPICVIALQGIAGTVLLIIVWSTALIGIVIKAFWMGAPRWLSTLLYVLMGWSVVIAIVPLYKVIPLSGVLLLTLSGITYTVGALIYALKKPNFNLKHFGFHEIFHVFVLLGSLFFIIFMFMYIV